MTKDADESAGNAHASRSRDASGIDAHLFARFEPLVVQHDGAEIHALVGGSGPPLLLLHGYPETRAAWHRIAPSLAQDYHVILPDLPGYGASRMPAAAPVERFGKGSIARDMMAVLDALDIDRAAVVAHDRGARVGYRMALDHPARVAAFASLTVIPTIEMWDRADMAFGMGAYHWYMLAQPFDLPERLIGSDPLYFIDATLDRMAGGLDRLDPLALEDYRWAFADPAVRHAMCQDYRAAATIDAEQDRRDRATGRKLVCPVLMLWSARQTARPAEAPLEIWERWADRVSGEGIAEGHLLPELAAQSVLGALRPFLSGRTSAQSWLTPDG